MLQHKSLPLSDCQIKLDESGAGRFAGYASVFGGVDSYGDTIIKGAYAYTLREHGKPKMFVNHESYALPVGKWLTAKEDDHGLLVEGELTPGMAQAADAHAALKHGTVDGLSIGYRLKKGDWEETETGGRIIRRVSHVAEVSIVTFPADAAARIDLSSVKAEGLDEITTERDLEYFLRDAGNFSRSLAKAVASRAKSIYQRDAEAEDERTRAAMMKRLQQITRSLT
ncbi:MAG: HK97 family phage prohead protease [Candidatus Accumulibacter phosphatis]